MTVGFMLQVFLLQIRAIDLDRARPVLAPATLVA